MAFERRARKQGFVRIAGVDEAGRGPLAGPVVAAACVLPQGFSLDLLDDSKKLSDEVRKLLFKELMENPNVVYGIGIVDPAWIDVYNILQASLQAMLLAIDGLFPQPDYLLIDGNCAPRTSIPHETIVKGDGLSYSIAAASVIAKVIRDRKMVEYHALYPHYGFDCHMGYGTSEHLQALKEHGPCPIHRKSFEPIKDLQQLTLF